MYDHQILLLHMEGIHLAEVIYNDRKPKFFQGKNEIDLARKLKQAGYDLAKYKLFGESIGHKFTTAYIFV